MRAQAKRSSAANRDGSATSGSVFGRRDSATRASSSSSDGSGALSHRRPALLVLSIVVLGILVFASLAQAKFVVGGFGTSGTQGGQFGTPGGIAVNNSGVGAARGTTYVVDVNGNRVQRFSPVGAFERAWGFDVVIASRPDDKGTGFEICTVAADCQVGSITPTTANNGQLNNPQGVAVNQANGHVYVTESGNRRVSEFDADGVFVRAWGWDVASTVNEVQTITVNAGAGDFRLTFNGQTTGDLAFDVSAAAMQTALNGLSSIAPGTVTVSGGPGAPGGGTAYTVTFATGTGIAATNVPELTFTAGTTGLSGGSGPGADTVSFATTVQGGGASTGFEICSALDSCKQAAAGGGAGQFSSNLGYPTVDAADNVWVPDQGNSRIQQFDSTGNFVRLLGGDVITNGASGTGTLAPSSRTISSLTTIRKFFEVGQTVTSPDHPGEILPGTTITAVGASSLTLSQATSASVTAGGQTITAAAGAGNVATNERQTVTIGGGPTDGNFNLTFNGATTGATGRGTLDNNTKIIRDVVTTTGTFAVGQSLTGTDFAPGTKITSIDTVNRIINVNFEVRGNGRNRTLTAASIPYNAPAALVQSTLNALSSIGGVGGSVSVSGSNGGPWTVEFGGTRFANSDVPQITADAAGLFPIGTIAITSANDFEVCGIPADCRTGAPGTAPGQFSGAGPGDLAIDATGNLYAIDSGNNRVQRFNPALTSVANFGTGTFPAFTTSAPERMAATQGGSRLAFAINAGVGERQILELDSTDASLRDTSLVGAGLGNVQGLAANDTTGTLYATTTASTRRVLALSAIPLADPVVPTMDAITVKTDTTATFSGTVDPRGGIGGTCKFQYSTDRIVWTDVNEPDCASLTPGGGAQAVSQNVTGLIPNTHYFVRLSVSRVLDPGSTRVTTPKAFDTDAVPPVVIDVGSVQVTDTSARMGGAVDPRHSATGYVFQYGTTPALGSSTDPVGIGDGTTPLVVSQVVSNLSPGTTYYFRLVATNLAGSTASATESFTTRTDPLPPADNRGYEQVSPVDKNSGAAFAGPRSTTVAYDGQAAGYCAASLFGDPPGVMPFACANYVSSRGPDRWRTKATNPPFCSQNPDSFFNSFPGQTTILSANLDLAVIGLTERASCAIPPLDPNALLTGGRNYYVEDLRPDPVTYDLLAPQPTATGTGGGSTYVGSSQDFGHVFFTHTGQQTLDAPAGNFEKLYEWDHGTLRLASIKPDGTPFGTAVIGVAALLDLDADLTNGVSRRGDRVFFYNPTSGSSQELYMRDSSAAATYWVSQQECTPACSDTSAADTLAFASPDGSKAFIRSAARLTDDDTSATANPDLYVYRHSADPATDRNLTLLSQDNEPADGTDSNVIDVLGVSDDGDIVFFAASGQIIAGEPTTEGPYVYRWRWNAGSPTVDYIVGVDASNWDSTNGISGASTTENRIVTPEGDYLSLLTGKRLVPGADKDSNVDVYRWGAQDGWACASCQLPGVPSAGSSTYRLGTFTDGAPMAAQNSRRRIVMSDDGQRIFFITNDALVPEDINGTVQDVYEWHDGALSLISSGTSPLESFLLGAGHTGEDVFFTTSASLVGWDTDRVIDVYDARIGGGLPEPPPTGAPCEGEACRDAGTNAPPATGAGTAVFQGPDNPRPGSTRLRRCPAGKRKVVRNGRTRCVKRHRKASANGRAAR